MGGFSFGMQTTILYFLLPSRFVEERIRTLEDMESITTAVDFIAPFDEGWVRMPMISMEERGGA